MFLRCVAWSSFDFVNGAVVFLYSCNNFDSLDTETHVAVHEPATGCFTIPANSARRTITSLQVKEDSVDMGVSILLLPVPRGGATLRTGCDKWQHRNCIISVSTKRKEKWSEHLASFFLLLFINILYVPQFFVLFRKSARTCTYNANPLRACPDDGRDRHTVTVGNTDATKRCKNTNFLMWSEIKPILC